MELPHAALFDLQWLKSKVEASGIDHLIAEVEAQANAEDLELSALADALRRSCYVAIDPSQLASQLYGRLEAEVGADTAKLLETIRETWSLPIIPIRSGYLEQARNDHKYSSPLGFLSDSRRLLSYRALHIVDVETGAMQKSGIKSSSGVLQFACSPSGKLAVVLRGTHWQSWNLEGSGGPSLQREGDCRSLYGWNEHVTMLDERRVLCNSYTNIVIFDILTGSILSEFSVDFDRISALAGSATQPVVAVSSDDGALQMWNTDVGDLMWSRDDTESSTLALEICSDGRVLFAGQDDGLVSRFDLDTGKTTSCLRGHLNGVTEVVLLQSGNILLSASLDQTLRLWDLTDNSNIGTMFMDEPIFCLVVAPNGRTLAVGDAKGNISGFRAI